MKRTRLAQRILPPYTRGEELVNTITHALGSLLGIAALVLCLIQSTGSGFAAVSSWIYGAGLVLTFTVSSVYHSLPANMGKKVMQIIDHCTIYLLIAGTYTIVLLCGLRPHYPVLSWVLFALEWTLAILAATLTAIDLRVYRVFSNICYIAMGWAILPFARQALSALGRPGFQLLLAGGIAYTVGAVLYGLGSKIRWMHSVFHVFVFLGALLQLMCVLLYVL